MKYSHTTLLCAAALAAAGPAHAGSPFKMSPTVAVQPLTTPSSPSQSSSVLASAEINSRSRALGGQASASGTRYISVTDQDIKGNMSNQDVQKVISGAKVEATDTTTRRIQMAVDVQKPLTIEVPQNQAFTIGTIQVDPNRMANLDIESYINAKQITVVTKPAASTTTPSPAKNP